MNSQDLKKFGLPDTPGVYYFLAPRTKNQAPEILYIGKATSLVDRVKSYFNKDIFLTRGPRIEKMLEEAKSVKFVATDSVLEALMLEAVEIKKHQPIYNSREKDDKSYNYIVITKEDFPKLLIVRGTNLKIENSKLKIAKLFGPFPHGKELKEALKIIRKIFPYRDDKCKLVGKPCFNAQIGLCPGPCARWISKREYRKIIKHIRLFLEAKKDKLNTTLEKEMKVLAKAEKFEEAEKVKRQIFALEHIQDVAMIRADYSRGISDGFTLSAGAPTPLENSSGPVRRIEAYDIAHLSGREAVGVMTVVTDGEIDKSQYRKFKIKGIKNPARPDDPGRSGGDDTANLREVLTRRFGHSEWPYPDLVVVDGGRGQINTARKVLKSLDLKVEVVSVLKDDRHRAKEVIGLKPDMDERAILLANSEAHRFSIGYHRKLRRKGFRI